MALLMTPSVRKEMQIDFFCNVDVITTVANGSKSAVNLLNNYADREGKTRKKGKKKLLASYNDRVITTVLSTRKEEEEEEKKNRDTVGPSLTHRPTGRPIVN
ncbi:hypothetical protein OUZ56_009144 [Daphnia magna]|uniref:Uncharacterized protein n=1 Tax=Daphnia magna TaxID=35525 RepID=A0ABR0AF41_9CRUS|nr:hypothetical protein OUZ56_009144 [Daphnia magna]